MTNTPGSGERRARRGFNYQDRASAVLAYQTILDGTLTFIALADDEAGMFDDFVIGTAGRVVGHQYKSSDKPKPVGVRGLLLGADNVIADCAGTFIMLERAFPGNAIELRYVTSHYAATGDKGQFGVPGKDSADFFKVLASHRQRSLVDWRATVWRPIIDDLLKNSGLSVTDFERFLSRLSIILGAPSKIELNAALDDGARTQVIELAHKLGDLASGEDGQTRWTRRELLNELGWADRFQLRFEHRFPLGAHVQSNEATEADLEAALSTHTTGYISLLGPPGAGKSTLLERFIQPGPGRDVVRYLAFVPGEAQGQGRGGDANFLADINSQLFGLGHQPARAKDDTLEQRRETFERLLKGAGKRYATDQQLTIIVVDGLDHVPREERPEASFLRALPLPQSTPPGVLFVLGSQRIDLADIPPEVRDQAGQSGRRVDIVPLDEVAVSDMIRSMGLDGNVATAEVFAVSQGHPLVTHYLLDKLRLASPAQRDALLAGGFEYDGDLEKIYGKAWREARAAGADVAKVLFVLGFVEGRIEPTLLARWLSSQAVDQAFRLAHHLIDYAGDAWRVFHNSFRLFLRQQAIELYGKPDPALAEETIYRELASLAKVAPSGSDQRFLAFRYCFLAGDRDQATALASRRYFVGQFIDGRRSLDVAKDIEDAFRCIGPTPAPETLFDLMLAKDEIWRRQDALGTAQQLIEAQIAAGALDLAEGQLESHHVVGDEWHVINALLDADLPERARRLFDRKSPWKWFDDGVGEDGADAVATWTDLAVILLDDEQIERRIRIPAGKEASDKDVYSNTTRGEYLAKLRFALARATLRHGPDRDVTETATRFGVSANAKLAILLLDGAQARLLAAQAAEALRCLADYETRSQDETLDGSWHLHAARLALAADDVDRAKRFFARARVPDLSNFEHKSEEVVDAVDRLYDYASLAARLIQGEIHAAAPSEFLFRGAQNQIIRLGKTIGGIKAGGLVDAAEVTSTLKGALTFLAGAVATRLDDVLLGYRVRRIDKPLFNAICDLVSTVPSVAPKFAAAFDACLQLQICSFRDNAYIHGRFAETMFAADGDAVAAVARLERARSAFNDARSPQDVIDQLAELAIAYGAIGFPDRARALLGEMREKSLGSYLAAKKDGQYHAWEGLLTAANRADPAGAADRAFTMLRQVAGVEETHANDQASRIAKSVLVEAIASGPTPAWDAYDWAVASAGPWPWPALVDAVARGILRRRHDLALPLAVTWTALCLPYYDEPYHSVTRFGQFLHDLVALAPDEDLSAIDRVIVDGLARDAMPSKRTALVRAFRDALADRGVENSAAHEAARHLTERVAPTDDDDDGLPDYFDLNSWEEIEQAVTADRARRDARTNTHYGTLVNTTLGKRIGRILRAKPWAEARSFAARHEQLVGDRPVRDALARAALAAGDRAFAETLLLDGAKDCQGWGGWADSKLLRHHQARHLLGLDDAHQQARNDFLRDLAVGGHGTGSALWSVDEIFPLLFEQVDWPAMWDRLAEQLQGYVEFQKVAAIPRDPDQARDDLDLIARLFLDAARFGASDPREQAGDGLLALVRAGDLEIFRRACARLLDGDSRDTLLGLRLLFEAHDNQRVADAFRDTLTPLAAHEDGCIAALAESLSHAWGGAALIPDVGLPAIYILELPPLDRTDRSLRDADSLAPVIDDPGAWTEGFESCIDMLSRYASVPTANIRHRVARLINGWGGSARFGAKATNDLEHRLRPLGLLLPFARPHIVVAVRALRVVIGDFWRAHRLSQAQFELLLHRLDGGPVLPPRNALLARPTDATWPALPSNNWSSRADDWLNGVDLRRSAGDERVVSEWCHYTFYELSSLFREDMLSTRGVGLDDADDFEAAVDQMPRAFWADGTITLFQDSHAISALSLNLRVSGIGERSEALIFNPVIATRLGWRQTESDPLAFSDDNDVLMVQTASWRDGWPQEMQHGREMRWADGQRVELTDAGLARLSKEEQLPPLATARWRTVTTRNPTTTNMSRWRSDAVSDDEHVADPQSPH
ncbi:hypothetical protein [Sphingomonas sp. CLY1604]|uniref:hypothetical protein n=1 Tax=Sphingomonas sp. CLY1604 TaxID=3457786 RepID=UPI003FD8B571